MNDVLQKMCGIKRSMAQSNGQRVLGDLVQKENLVGDVYWMNYDIAHVQISDYKRQKVGGIPALSFLLATRLYKDAEGELKVGTAEANISEEDTSLILLRVMDSVPLPTDKEAERLRVEQVKKVDGNDEVNWEYDLDETSRGYFSYAGISCKIVGTFYVGVEGNLCFGSDISNYYPNRGLKVYKPTQNALESIVNYTSGNNENQERTVIIGHVRYASTNRDLETVAVKIHPADFCAQKTALFGMTRTGKSNTTKTLIKSLFELRESGGVPRRLGQLVFDPNGEYANENTQDTAVANAIKNVWKCSKVGKESDVTTYGSAPNPLDPKRNLMLINFFNRKDCQTAKEYLNQVLADDVAKYISNFGSVIFEEPEETDVSAKVRFDRRLLCFYALLVRAGFDCNKTAPMSHNGLFSKEFLDYLGNKNGKMPTTKEGELKTTDEHKREYVRSEALLRKSVLTWDELNTAIKGVAEYVKDNESSYSQFEAEYNEKNDKDWADGDLKKILDMFVYPNGAKQLGKAQVYHSSGLSEDYVDAIYRDLLEGKLVIVDQSTGDPIVNQTSAERVMRRIFEGNSRVFSSGKTPIDIIVYVEEAHNLLPASSELDLRDIWVRTAKEGGKFKIGLIYATQEVSSIQKNILKNTSNWFIGHLNNSDETRELKKFYDFGDFEKSILRADDKGFLRIKTLSNKYVIPTQVLKFTI